MPVHPAEETTSGSTSFQSTISASRFPIFYNTIPRALFTRRYSCRPLTDRHRHHRQGRKGVQGLQRLHPPDARYVPSLDHHRPRTDTTLDEENQATSGGSVAANAHKANPVRSTPSLLDRIQHAGWTLTGRQGPVHADNLPEPATKEELKKRAEELNK
jgi:hypothetical protein